MTSERRWLDENAPDDVRRLLESAELDEPTSTQLESLRARVAPLMNAPPSSPSPSPKEPSGPSAPSAGAAPLAGKILLGVALLAVGGGVGLWFGKQSQSEPPPPVPVQVVAPTLPTLPTVTPPAPTPAEPAPIVPAPAPKPSPKLAAPPAPAPAPPSEDEELAQLQEAMAAPTADASLALLQRHAQRFPNSTLTQEREVLTVKALMKLERVDEARTRAAQFKERWPTSPHLLRIEALVGK